MKKQLLICALALPMLFVANISNAADLNEEEKLGKALFEDKNFSRRATQSCKTCHNGLTGFADPTNVIDPENTVVSLGDDGESLGGRNAPTAAYAGYSPVRFRDQVTGEYYGGLFWDGRKDGSELGDPLAEQAQGPPLNPVEMDMESVAAVVDVIEEFYLDEFKKVYRKDFVYDDQIIFNLFARAIAAYERSAEVEKFDSYFDRGVLTSTEKSGKGLFKKHCAVCHSMDNNSGNGPLFTTFGYANIGIPDNPIIDGDNGDLGLGAIVIDENPALQNGKFKIPTLRNVAVTAPYGHNGYFPTLQDIVNFKNTRDVGDWEMPDVNQNLTYMIGDLGLTDNQVNSIVQFLKTLTDR
jgi:cytochrome c peroxidase